MSKEKFIKIFNTNIKREGAARLLNFIEKKDFFTAPASTKYHLAKEGGLAEHSLNVYYRLKELVEAEQLKKSGTKELDPETLESVTIVALLHDLCKMQFYKVSTRNVKNEETGQWEKVPFYTVDDLFPYGHGEKSVFLIERYMHLKTDEAIAIRWHMGSFEETDIRNVSNAFNKYPLAVLISVADQMATFLDEREG